jgi:hypothetical protein
MTIQICYLLLTMEPRYYLPSIIGIILIFVQLDQFPLYKKQKECQLLELIESENIHV